MTIPIETPRNPHDDQPLSRGAPVGRYVVLERVGGGAMGVVYTAYDPELDRRIALKVLRPDAVASPDARARLVREAQALARLSHPNVITVHDVGIVGDQVFLAMDFVEGRSLQAWLDAHPRALREVLGVFREAGVGLSAAHAAGVIHRDFKPENVLVGNDGRVRVVDFGVARRAMAVPKSASDAPPPMPQASTGPLSMSQTVPDSAWKTREGALIGTPAYMSPEQVQGRQVDARSDQFSFCVALYEALYGELPFEGTTTWEVWAAALEGRVREAPRGAGVPAWIRRVLLRGLRAKAEERHASMDALLFELRRNPRVRQLRAAAVSLAIAAILGAVGLIYRGEARKRAAACTSAGQGLADVWNDARREQLASALRRDNAPYAEHAVQEVTRTLDDYTRAWSAMNRDACEATHVRGDQSQALLERRTDCLSERRDALDALIDVLVQEDAIVQGAVGATQRLPSLRDCEGEGLRGPRANLRSPAGIATAHLLRRPLAMLRALDAAGKYREAEPLAERVVADARASMDAAAEAEALYLLGDVRDGVGDAEGAEGALVQAAARAEKARSDEVRAKALTLLVYEAGSAERDPERGRLWAELASAAIDRAGASDALRATLNNRLGLIAIDEGHLDRAASLLQDALATRERLYGASGLEVEAPLGNLAECWRLQGRFEEASRALERAVAIREGSLGAMHPDVAVTLRDLGYLRLDEGRMDEAAGHFRRALGIDESALGPSHVDVARDLAGVGIALEDAEKHDEALGWLERSVSLWDELRPNDPDAADALTGVGRARLGRGEPALALPSLERALHTREAKAVEPASLASTRFALARTLDALRMDPARVAKLLAQARDGYRSAGARGRRGLAEVRGFCSRRPGYPACSSSE